MLEFHPNTLPPFGPVAIPYLLMGLNPKPLLYQDREYPTEAKNFNLYITFIWGPYGLSLCF